MKKYANFEELAKSDDHEIGINSDLLRFTTLYQSFGIECRILSIRTNTQTRMYEKGKEEINYKIVLAESNTCSQECDTLSDKLDGYNGFYSSINFDKHGKFIKQGFWE